MHRLASAAAVAAALIVAGAGAGAPMPAPPRDAELAALGQAPVRTAIASERIYFVMPDRYANANPVNDRGGLEGGREVTGYDPTDAGWFHGGDLAGLTGDCSDTRRGLARLRELGFTAIWTTPPYRQKFVQNDSAAYHGYWALDLTTVDPHLGTEQEFGAFVDCAHRLGMKVYLDVVVNHTADVIELSSYDFVAPPRAPHVPTIPPRERAAKRPAWLNDPANYHNRGNIDFNSCSETCFELGDFFGLDDLATERPNVRDGLAEIYATWIRRYRIDGFRIDTARHVDRAFFRLWVPRVLAAARDAGVPSFEIFGEAFLNDAVGLSAFVRDRGLPNVLDFPLQDAAVGFAAGIAGADGIADRLRDDDYFALPSGIAHTPPTFLGNHDIGRAAGMIKDRSLTGGEQLLNRVLLGYSLLYLLRGAPVVYYGDEFGITGRGGDRAARHDLFSTQVREWQTEERIGSAPIGTGSSFDVVGHPVSEHLRALGALRVAHPALSTGATIIRRADRNVLAVSRIDAADRREYVAVFNAGIGSARFTIATATPEAEWTPLLGATSDASSTRNGSLTLTAPPHSSALLQATRQVSARRPPRPRLVVAHDSRSGLVRISATAGAAPVSVAFAIRRAGATRWQRLAADDSPPYRAFLDPAKFRRRERVHVLAVARALDGSTAVSRVVPFVIRR